MVSRDEYRSWDAVAMGGLIARREVTAEELEAACRVEMAALEPELGAVADVVAPGEVATTGGSGPLVGVPFAVKELLGVPGLPWTFGSRLFAQNPAGPPSPYVERLASAGLRIVCSTASSELGLLGSTESALRGITRNPWGAGLAAGGSSGGSAAAVAAGIVPMAHANDAGGSIRGPAALTGCFGFLPSLGRCAPTGPDAAGLSALVIDHAISRSVRDSAALLAATERDDAAAPYEPIGWITAPADARLRVGVLLTSLQGETPSAAVAGAVERSASRLAALGHHVEAVATPAIDGEALSHAFFASAARTVASMVAMVTPMLGRTPGADDLEPFTLDLAAWAETLPPDDGQVAATLALAAATYLRLFDDFDVVLSPTLGDQPWPLGTLAPDLGREELVRRTERLVGYTPIHNIAGSPAMSVPLERHAGQPIGVHLAAAPGADATLLGLAFELEAAHPWGDQLPRPVPGD